jgi:hypothetical protein
MAAKRVSKGHAGGKVRAPGGVLQLKISLMGIRPPIWRRLLIPGALQLSDLHQVIQTAFGWTDSHLHQFEIAGQRFGQPDDFDEKFLDEAEVTVSQAVGRSVKRFSYMYDFGDDWGHEIVVERVIGGDAGSERPFCIGGRRHRPPEDCGGASGYAEFLEAIRDSRHPQHAALRKWAGGAFDPEEFDVAAVNRALAEVLVRHAWVQ